MLVLNDRVLHSCLPLKVGFCGVFESLVSCLLGCEGSLVGVLLARGDMALSSPLDRSVMATG